MNASSSARKPTDANPPANIAEFALHWTDANNRDDFVALANNRVKIGAGANCDIVLQDSERRPLQCLVVHGPRGVFARNWRADAALNGNSFTEAFLQPGDRMSFGNAQFELVDRTSVAPAAQPEQEPAAKTADNSATVAALEEAARQIQQLNQSLTESRNEAAANQQRLGELQAEIAELQSANQQPAAAESASPVADEASINELQRQKAELDALQKELYESRETLRSEREEVESVLRAERDRLIVEAANIEAEKERLAQEQANAQNEPVADDGQIDEVAAQAEQLAQRERQLEETIAREQAELNAQREQLEQMQAELASERKLARLEIEKERLQLQAEMDEMRSSTTDEVVESYDNTHVVDAAETADEPVENDYEQANEPRETAEDVIERMRAAGIYNESSSDEASADRYEEEPVAAEEQPEEEAQPSLGDAAPVSFIDRYKDSFADEFEDEAPAQNHYTPQPSYDESPAETYGEPEPSGEEGEDSIEDYMAQLMQRLQGGVTGEAPAPKPDPKPVDEVVETPEPVAAVEQPPVAEKEVVMDASEYKPRSSAPEQNSNMAAMRDLANQSARSAIKTSTTKVRWAFAGARFGMALFFFSIGSVMFYMKDSLLSPMFFGALVTGVGGIVLCYQGVQILAGKNPNAPPRILAAKKAPKDQFEEE